MATGLMVIHNSGFDPDSPSELLNIEPIKAVHAPHERPLNPGANLTGAAQKKQKRNAQFQPRPHYYNCVDLKKKKCYK